MSASPSRTQCRQLVVEYLFILSLDWDEMEKHGRRWSPSTTGKGQFLGLDYALEGLDSRFSLG